MNKIILVLALLIAFTSLQAEARTHRQGGNQVTTNTLMVGVGVSGMELNRDKNFPGTINVDYADVTVKELADLRAHNVINLRLPFASDRMQQSYLATLDTTYTAQMDAIVARAAANDQKIIWDDHQFGAMHSHTFGDGTLTAPIVADWCTKFATHYLGSKTVVGFEITNEPNGSNFTNWFNHAQACITAYRAVDPDMPLYVDGYGFASEYQWLGNGNDGLKHLVDPNHHLVIVGHAYGDFDNCGIYPVFGSSTCTTGHPTNSVCTPGASSYVCATQMGDQMDSPAGTLDTNILVKRANTYFFPWCKAYGTIYGFTCSTTEQGVPNDDPNWLKALQNSIDNHLVNNVPIFYWAAGEFFGDYNLGIQNQSSGIDTVQWAVLAKYLNSPQNTTYQMTGPTRGTAGSVSSNFSVTYKGYHNKAFKITPSAKDSVTGKSSGGTFTPSSLTIPDGFNGSGNFTYNSSGSASFAVGLTNDYGLTDPSAFGYATASDPLLVSGASTVNVCGLQKVNAPYIGPLLQLRRSIDNATKDFYPLTSAVGSLVNTTAITAWAAGSNLFLTDCYGQYQGFDFVPVNLGTQDPDAASHSPTPSLVDEPRFYTDCGDGLPCVDMSAGGRLAAKSPVPNLTTQSVLAVFSPASNTGDGLFLGWDWSGSGDSISWANDEVQIQGASKIRAYSTTNEFHSLGETWTSGGSVSAFRDGSKVNTGSGGSSVISLPFNRSNLNMGYARFSGQTFTGKWREIAVLNNALTDSAAIEFTSTQAHRWSIAHYDSSIYPPTLQQNIGSGNAPFWAGVNIAGAVAGGGFSDITCSPGVNGGTKCPWNKAIPTSEPAYYASRGMNIVRLLVKWPALQPSLCTGDTTLDATQLAKLDTAIAQYNAVGIDVMIDLHAYGSYNYSNWTTCASPPDDGNIVRTQTGAYFANFWTQMGTHYASNPKVYFDLTNEPNGQTASVQAPIFQAAINGARGAGFNNYIFTEWGSSFAACDSVSTGAGAAFLTLTDTANKLVLECHRYVNSCNNDQCGEGSSQGRTDLTSATTYCASNGCHLFWGEFNATFNPQMYTELKADFDLIAANPTVWYGWSEYAGGPAWTEMYQGLVEPLTYPTPFVDRPQMKFLNTYATGHVWKCKGGTNGTVGVCPGTWPDAQFP